MRISFLASLYDKRCLFPQRQVGVVAPYQAVGNIFIDCPIEESGLLIYGQRRGGGHIFESQLPKTTDKGQYRVGESTCWTIRTLVRNHRVLCSLRSMSSILIDPFSGSYHRSRSAAIVLFPEPLGPTMAMDSLAAIDKEKFCRTECWGLVG